MASFEETSEALPTMGRPHGELVGLTIGSLDRASTSTYPKDLEPTMLKLPDITLGVARRPTKGGGAFQLLKNVVAVANAILELILNFLEAFKEFHN